MGVLLYLVLAVLSGGGTSLSGPLGNLDGSQVSEAPPGQVLGRECRTGADANRREDCRIVGDINSVQSYWTSAFSVAGRSYVPAQTVFFTGSTSAGCGEASTDVGPFYCRSTSASTSTSASSTSSGRDSARMAARSRRRTQVNPKTWTHGSSAERRHWFEVGYSTGQPSACDTFHAHL